jgi:bifunctional DNA-binding transcriptional regulator/antitoxin component of YhaV-PrlF toxin-antitoxin module
MPKKASKQPLAKIVIIRQRGQITIPDSIRQSAPWIIENQPVNVYLVNENEVRISPVGQAIDWEKLQRDITTVRALPGEDFDSTSFIAEDRKTH